MGCFEQLVQSLEGLVLQQVCSILVLLNFRLNPESAMQYAQLSSWSRQCSAKGFMAVTRITHTPRMDVCISSNYSHRAGNVGLLLCDVGSCLTVGTSRIHKHCQGVLTRVHGGRNIFPTLPGYTCDFKKQLMSWSKSAHPHDAASATVSVFALTRFGGLR